VIAAIGVNHNCDLAAAKALVLAAKGCGADCAKFQSFQAERLVTPSASKASYQQRTTAAAESHFEMLKRLELSGDAHRELAAFCAEHGIDFLSTPYSEEDARLLAALDVGAFKVPSALIVESAFLEALAAFGKPLIVSTGMATLPEVRDAVDVVHRIAGTELILLQCTTEYPTDIDAANVRVMQTIATTFGVPVGRSDHAPSDTAAIGAVALGASVIEKHLTLDKALEGPDHSSSADPADFSRLVAAIREAELALGRSDKEPTPAERANSAVMRRSVVARSTIPAGAVLNANMLTMKRPGAGIPPKDLPRVVGTRARLEIAADCPLEWWMLERPGDH